MKYLLIILTIVVYSSPLAGQTKLSSGAELLFKQVKSALSAADKNKLFLTFYKKLEVFWVDAAGSVMVGQGGIINPINAFFKKWKFQVLLVVMNPLVAIRL